MIDKGIIVYCRCEICDKYFEIGVKRSKFCGKRCRDKEYYRKKKLRDVKVKD